MCQSDCHGAVKGRGAVDLNFSSFSLFTKTKKANQKAIINVTASHNTGPREEPN